MAISITQLSKYLSGRDSGPSTEISWGEAEEIDQELPWNGLSCLSVVCYVLKFCSSAGQSDIFHTIKRLNDLATEINKSSPEDWELAEREHEFAETFVHNFMPKVQHFFTVPVSGTGPDRLSDFIHFLLQILNSESDGMKSATLQAGLTSLREGLSFLLAVLGDTPFPHMEMVEDLLVDFKSTANETGSFVYSCVFRTSPPDLDQLHAAGSYLLEKVDLLKRKIKEHCIRVSDLPLVIPGPENLDASDSFYVVDSLLADLENFLTCRVDSVGEIRALRDELLLAKSLLRDTPQEARIGEMKQCVIQVRDIASETDHLINSFVVGDFPDWYINIRIPTVIRKLKLIQERFDFIRASQDIQALKLQEDLALQISSQSTLLAPIVDDNTLVGFESETIKILHELVGGSKNLRMISIYGMPGLGKTTLAKKLYNHRLVVDYFDESAWCVVSQTYHRRRLLIDILMSLRNMQDKEKIIKMDDNSLSLVMYKFLSGRRYLVVLDDAWDSGAWDYLRRFFPDNKNGSRVLITTRNQDAIQSDTVCKLPFLSGDQCWELLAKKVFHDRPSPEHLLGYGRRIAAKCNGLPLAVVVVAGLLVKMQQQESVWGKVEQSLGTYTRGCNKILELSYKHLPDHLKLCFLYLGVFPEDAEIPVQKLIWLWKAEGFLRNDHSEDQEHLAREYLKNLIDRGLVLVVKDRSTGGVKACTIHDLLREMCIEIAHKENFLNIIKDGNMSTYDRHQRLSVLFTSPAHLRSFSIHCRSFFGHISDPSSCLPQMKQLRVMHLSPNQDVNVSYKLKRIDLLVNLRYLVVDRMPEPIVGNLVHLEVLVVETMSNAVYVPSIILNMEKLRHLHVKRQAKFQDDCDGSQQNNLQSLSFLSIQTVRI